MKLTVEIKDGQFLYEYKVGENTHKSSRPICADSLILFSDLLKVCSSHKTYEDKIWERELCGKVWLEKQAKGE